jgi:hypothetical protein
MSRGAHGGCRQGAGRPTGSANRATAEVREIAGQWGPAAIRRAAELAGLVLGADGRPVGAAKSEAAQIAALEIVLNRAYGRPSQPLAHSLELEASGLDALLRERLARAKAASASLGAG